ncbi:hypothetical protein TIFTF001_025830 [Ficus carica]|uniref:Uncharacterized protein n=1 Tax=Ficus carica TaxID=3494 RepID=A0AA88AQH5_FICCA|nr:hypothetical protein TIFTF001_025830 [Ficus carica]
MCLSRLESKGLSNKSCKFGTISARNKSLARKEGQRTNAAVVKQSQSTSRAKAAALECEGCSPEDSGRDWRPNVKAAASVEDA